MGLFDFLRKPRIRDEKLGELRYWLGEWSGDTARCLGQEEVALSMPGRINGVEEARSLLDALELQYEQIKAQLEPKFREHFEVYRAASERPDGPDKKLIKRLEKNNDIWAHVTLVSVDFEVDGKKGDVGLAYEIAWDEEHGVEVLVRDGAVVDYCG